VVVETEARERAAKELFRYVATNGPAELRRNVEASDTRRLADGYFRTCVPHDDRRGWTCFFVDTRRPDTRLIQDPSAIPNPRR
jgi:hypothetical protein